MSHCRPNRVGRSGHGSVTSGISPTTGTRCAKVVSVPWAIRSGIRNPRERRAGVAHFPARARLGYAALMPVETWFRNPENYIKELVECNVNLIAFDRGYLIKKHLDPIKWCDVFFPASVDYRALLVGTQGTAEYARGTTHDTPVAVYPTWDYLQDGLGMLEELMANPVGENPAICGDMSVPADQRPVLGQEHRVVVVHLPISSSGPGRRILNELKLLQEDYPECILHVHGLYGFRVMFSNRFRAVDYEPRELAFKGKVIIPSGKEMRAAQTRRVPHWVTILGMSPVDLEKPRNRCIYNIKSAQWAAKYFNEPTKFRAIGGGPIPDVDSPDGEAKAIEVKNYRPSGRPGPGDKVLCDTCSLARSCKFYREGSVCTLPGSEVGALAAQFNTRNADEVVDGIGIVLATQTRRMQRGVEYEELDGELDPEVTRIANSIMTHARKLAILLKPQLANPKLAVIVPGGSVESGPINNRVVAQAYGQLVEAGIPREKITEAMVMKVIGGEPPTDALLIEGVAASEAAG